MFAIHYGPQPPPATDYVSFFRILIRKRNGTFVKKISPQEATELYTISISIIKTLIVILQQFHSQFVEKLQLEKSNDMLLSISSIFKSLEILLEEESTLLNCKINCGIAVPLLIKVTDIKLLNPSKSNQNMHSDMEIPFDRYIGKFPPSSQLCLWSGILAGIPIKELMKPDDKIRNLFLHVVFPEILKLAESVNDSAMSLASSRVLHQWVEVGWIESDEAQPTEQKRLYTKALCDKIYFSELSEQLKGGNEAISQLLGYIWSHWDHFVDGVRHYCRCIFKNIINLHCLSTEEVPEKSQFLRELAESLLHVMWHQRGKYAMLSCLVEQMGSSVLLDLSPSLPKDILNALKEHSIACHVAELAVVIYKQDFNKSQKSEWENRWLVPLLEVFCFGMKIQKSSIKEYILPEVLKISPSSIHFIISELTHIQDKCFPTLLLCVKEAQIQGIIDNANHRDPEMWQGCLSFSVLQKAMHHLDHEVQLSAFSLLCTNTKTTQSFTAKEFELLKEYLPWCFSSQFPAFRQKLLAELKKLLLRIKDSGNNLLKKLQKDQNSSPNEILTLIQTYKIFLSWLTSYTFSCLAPGANFPRRYMALQLLLLKKSIFTKDSLTDMQFYEDIPASKYQAQILFEFLKDTYENNKIAILQLLEFCPFGRSNFQNISRIKEIFKTALVLASSTKPPESLTAAYLFRLLVTLNATREIALEILVEFYTVNDDDLESIKKLNPSLRTTYLIVIKVLLINLRYQLNRAYISLLEAAANNPLYGIITCIRFVLAETDLSSGLDKEETACWRNLLSELIMYSFKTTSAVAPIVCNSSPEGHLPMDTDPETLHQLQSAIQKAIGHRFECAEVVETLDSDCCESSTVTIDVMKTRAVTAQMLLLCSWRAHKEVSLLLGDICQKIAIVDEKQENGFLSCDQILQIGAFFNQQLAEVKHRGAFEQAYIGFSKLCHRLWRSNRETLHQLPNKWLQELFDTMCGIGDLKLCPTRRSAGIPFVAQALLITEPEVTGSSSFKQAMEKLLYLSQSNENIDAKVHALNILRAIYRDTCLGERVMPFVADGLKISIQGFKTIHWGVRNSATLLFTSLMTRIFGVNRSKEEPQKKNRMTGRVFFLHFPSLFQFLLNELQEETKDLLLINNCRSIYHQTTLYPILLLLSRLYPSPVEGSDSNLKLTSFVPYVQQAACSAVWKTRILAARALIPLLSPNECIQFLNEIIDSISINDLSYQNKLHGKLLQIYYLLQEIITSSSSLKNFQMRLSDWIKNNFEFLIRKNPTFVTRAAFLDIVYLLLSHQFILLELQFLQSLHQEFLIKNDDDDMTVPVKVQYFALSARTIVLLMLQVPQPENKMCKLLEDMLKSTYYEVRAVVLNFLRWLLTPDSANIIFTNIPLSIQWKWPLTYKNKHVLTKTVAHSKSVRFFVLEMMLQNENQPNCLEELYLLLCNMQNISMDPWIINRSETLVLTDKLNWVLEKIETTDWDDLINALFSLSVNVAIACYCFLCESEPTSQESKTMLSVLNKWMKKVNCNSYSNQSISRRMTIASLLEKCVETMLTDPKKLLGHHTIALWNSLIILLQDDEPEIRGCCSNVVAHLISWLDKGVKFTSLTPLLALDILIKKFVEHYNQICPVHCFVTLLNWMLQYDKDDDPIQGDEQPFDKGELNVYSEEVTFANLVGKELTIFLESLSDSSTQIPSDGIQDKFFIPVTEISHDLTLVDIANVCLEEANSLFDEFTNDCHSSFSSSKSDQLQIKFYQRIKIFLCIFHSCNLKVNSVENLVMKLENYQPLSEFMYCILTDLKKCNDKQLQR